MNCPGRDLGQKHAKQPACYRIVIKEIERLINITVNSLCQVGFMCRRPRVMHPLVRSRLFVENLGFGTGRTSSRESRKSEGAIGCLAAAASPRQPRRGSVEASFAAVEFFQ